MPTSKHCQGQEAVFGKPRLYLNTQKDHFSLMISYLQLNEFSTCLSCLLGEIYQLALKLQGRLLLNMRFKYAYFEFFPPQVQILVGSCKKKAKCLKAQMGQQWMMNILGNRKQFGLTKDGLLSLVMLACRHSDLSSFDKFLLKEKV